MKHMIMALAALALIGCGTGGGSGSASLELGYGTTAIDTSNVQSIYIADINKTEIGYIPEGYELQINADGSAIITKVDEQATISVTGDSNIIINCTGGECPVELVLDSNNDSHTEDYTHEPTVVEQNNTSVTTTTTTDTTTTTAV